MFRPAYPSVGTTPTGLSSAELPQWAEDASRHLLASDAPRLAHTLGVGRQARRVSRDLGFSGSHAALLEAAAILHDVGYARTLRRTGFHPVDGARYVSAMTGNRALAGLVAHHSYARVEARLRERTREMGRFAEPDAKLADALTYCDMTVGPQGQPMSVDQRLSEIHARYESHHVVARAVAEARPLLLAAVLRTETRIRVAAAGGQRKTA